MHATHLHDRELPPMCFRRLHEGRSIPCCSSWGTPLQCAPSQRNSHKTCCHLCLPSHHLVLLSRLRPSTNGSLLLTLCTLATLSVQMLAFCTCPSCHCVLRRCTLNCTVMSAIRCPSSSLVYSDTTFAAWCGHTLVEDDVLQRGDQRVVRYCVPRNL